MWWTRKVFWDDHFFCWCADEPSGSQDNCGETQLTKHQNAAKERQEREIQANEWNNDNDSSPPQGVNTESRPDKLGLSAAFKSV